MDGGKCRGVWKYMSESTGAGLLTMESSSTSFGSDRFQELELSSSF